MAGVWAWVRADLRGRRFAALALVLLIGLSTGVALTALAGARRTDTAYGRFLDASRSATHRVELMADDEVRDEVARRLRRDPAVEAVATIHFFIGLSDVTELDVGVLASPERELFRDIDQIRVLDGRLPDPDARDEVIINELLASSAGLRPGDRLSLATFSADQVSNEDFEGGPQGPPLDLEVVGVGRIPEDLADDQTPFAFAGPAFFRAFHGVAGSHPPSLDLVVRTGADGEEVVARAVDGLPLERPPAVEGVELRSDRVRDATSVLVTGLLLFAACAGAAALVASSQALVRRVSTRTDDQAALAAIGVTRRQRTLALVLSAVAPVAGGAVLAVGVAIIGSLWMPIGLARRAEPSLGVDADWTVLALGALAIVVALLAIVTTSAIRSGETVGATTASRAVTPARRSIGAAIAERAGWSPPAAVGITMALEPGRGRSAVPVRPALAGAIVGVLGVVAVLTFGASLTRLVDTPSAYGFNWDLSPDLFADDPERLAARPEVRDLGVILFRETIVDGQTIDGMAVVPVKGDPSLTVLSGRMPGTTGEVALGPKTVDKLRAGIGERIEARDADGDTIEVEVVGEVLFPTFDENPFNEGLAFHPDLAVDEAESAGFGQGMVDFEPGVSLERAVEIANEVAPGSVTVYARPSRPPDIANLAQVRRMPMVLAAFLVLLALAAVAHALATAVRRRRRELGVMRALGFRRRDVAATVTVQSLTLVVLALLFGVPLGIATGRMAWTVLADGLGVAPAPSVPVVALLLLVLSAVALAVALAGLPARAAARIHPAEALRTE